MPCRLVVRPSARRARASDGGGHVVGVGNNGGGMRFAGRQETLVRQGGGGPESVDITRPRMRRGWRWGQMNSARGGGAGKKGLGPNPPPDDRRWLLRPICHG